MRWFLPFNGGVAEVAHHQLSWRGSIRPSSRHQECAAETYQQKQKQKREGEEKTRYTKKIKRSKREREREEEKDPAIPPPLRMVCLNANRVINV